MNLRLLRVLPLICAGLYGVGTAPPANAETPPAKKDYYREFRRRYVGADLPPAKTLVGWYSGRCASVKKPDLLIAGLLTTFRRGTEIVTLLFTESEKPANYYDVLQPEAEREISDWLAKYGPEMPAFRNAGTYWEFLYRTKTDRYVFRARGDRQSKVVVSFINRNGDLSCFFRSRDRVHR